ncbi:MAG: hypothetical protein UZ21_OP11001000062 [Microgenomates bacterium OLB22]|nr:MAG: hypothetical protein UZ21_OP11001000062 [Microgenomates bacterium OLB22]
MLAFPLYLKDTIQQIHKKLDLTNGVVVKRILETPQYVR